MGKAGHPMGPAVSLEHRVLRYIQDCGLLLGVDRLLVGVSGGPDSVCLLHLLARARERLGIQIHAAHLDHGLRGAESDADRNYVTKLCRRLHVPLSVEKMDVAARRRKHSPLEEVAREERYSFFARAAQATMADAVAVGHTADDHLETVLLHLLRGSGTRGLRGLEPRTRWGTEDLGIDVVRPLLEMRRAETEEYCRLLRLRPRQDASNLSTSLLRNRIRLELMPLLRQYNPSVEEALARTARIARDDLRALEAWASELWGSVAHQEGDALYLSTQKLQTCPPGLRRVLLRRALESLLGGPRDIEFAHIESLMEALGMPAGKGLSLLGGVVVTAGYGELVLSHGPPPCPLPPLQGEHPLLVPGETLLPDWRVVAEVRDTADPLGHQPSPNPLETFLDWDKIGQPLSVRARLPGDRFQPLGMAEPKKLQDFMVDARIPRSWRDGIPLVCSPEHILWVVGWRLDERARVSRGTRRVLRLQFERV
ncbi:MAG: tRNA lysidine(34) synthetase TilS [Chloroflexota bacterium]